jgi:hypothetical protein
VSLTQGNPQVLPVEQSQVPLPEVTQVLTVEQSQVPLPEVTQVPPAGQSQELAVEVAGGEEIK